MKHARFIPAGIRLGVVQSWRVFHAALWHSPVAQLVERLTVNEAATYGVVSAVDHDVSRMAELIPSEPA